MKSQDCSSSGFNVMAMPVAVDANAYQSRMVKGFETMTLDLYSEMLSTKHDKNQKEINELMKMIKSLQRSNQREKEDLLSSHEETMRKMLKAHKIEIERLSDELTQKIKMETAAELTKMKRIQWCACCKKEASLYCCWNTSYCNTECQNSHWVSHIKRCERKKKIPAPI